jgi:hypothetical protein
VPERKARRRVIVTLWRGGVTQRSGARGVHRDRKPVGDGYNHANYCGMACPVVLAFGANPETPNVWEQ